MAHLEHISALAAQALAVALELLATLLIALGAVRAIIGLARARLVHRLAHADARAAFLELAGWLMLGLEFTLASDVIRTAIAPTWQTIAQLAAIAVIRTFLNFFLERDLEKAATPA